MKNRIARAVAAAAMSAMLCVSLASPVSAAQSLFGDMEAKSRQAVEAAIKAGSVPAGTTIYDCAYGADANGNTIVIQYRDKDGKWVDVVTGKPAASTPAAEEKPAADALAEQADQMLALINQERESVGAAPVTRSDFLDAAALTRAQECASLNSQRVDGKAHTRPDGSRWFTVLGIDVNYNYGENVIQGGDADNQMKRFMASEGHKALILKPSYTEVGIGCAISEEGNIFTVQIFYNDK
ncbi:CAP domain-containing protein [Ruminococcaceae bacterium OttesenSCG-928-L11]|nr:CAP domain-containing protein [Ruminococcaceae bacterium OttesenSCG-928-L11]